MTNGSLKVLLIRLGEALRVGLWFVPTLMVATAIAAAFGALTLDRRGAPDPVVSLLGFAYSGGPEGARQMLSTIATSMMTVAGVSFSVTIVALSLASQQFGPRLLRNFLKDLGNQVVLGTFIATYVYCLLVLRAVRGGDDEPFTPHLAVTGAVALTLIGVAVLIYFVHHVSSSIHADSVVGRTAEDLDDHIERLQDKEGPADESAVVVPPDDAQKAHHARGGYIANIDYDALVELAARENLLIRLLYREGQFCVPGAVLAHVWGAAADSGAVRRVADHVTTGEKRMTARNLEFSVGQLAELAVRSLSTGINDPFTAIACIDRLAAALARLSRLPVGEPVRRDHAGSPRVIPHALTFVRVVEEAFEPIRRHGAGDAAVSMRLLDSLAAIAEGAPGCAYSALRRQAALVRETALAAGMTDEDEREIETRHERVLRLTAT